MNSNSSPIAPTEPLHRLLRRRRQELSLIQADIAEALHVTPLRTFGASTSPGTLSLVTEQPQQEARLLMIDLRAFSLATTDGPRSTVFRSLARLLA